MMLQETPPLSLQPAGALVAEATEPEGNPRSVEPIQPVKVPGASLQEEKMPPASHELTSIAQAPETTAQDSQPPKTPERKPSSSSLSPTAPVQDTRAMILEKIPPASHEPDKSGQDLEKVPQEPVEVDSPATPRLLKFEAG